MNGSNCFIVLLYADRLEVVETGSGRNGRGIVVVGHKQA